MTAAVREVRGALWTAGAPARLLLIGLIHAYRATFAHVLGGQCRFHPSCSAYAIDAIRIHGAVRGALLSAWRILRCNPFGSGGIEPVPGKGEWARAFVRRRHTDVAPEPEAEAA